MSEKRISNNGKSIQNTTVKKVSTKKKLRTRDYFIIAFVIFMVLAIAIGIISSNASRNYYLKDIKILECSVIQKEKDSEKYYIKLPEKVDNISISEENSWVGVNSDFYNKIQVNNKIGVKLNNLDVYSKGLFSSKGQTFEKNIWNIEDVYESKAAADNANLVKKFNKQATIEKKKITQKGDHFFVINSEQKSMPVLVEEETYTKYNLNDKINCEFESIGELTRFIKIVQ